ncbi:MAG: hypothetical protein J5785_06215 [Spirochaetales bacterium]|nr:hypothetical protein [Spirochaetales bacterium]
METFKIGICEPEDFSPSALRRLETLGEVSLFDGGNLKKFISDKDAIFVRLKYLIDDELTSCTSRLKYICSPTTGLNHIAVTDSQISVISLKGEYDFLSSIRATPEHVFGLTLALLRNYSHAFLNTGNTVFDRNPYRGHELFHNSIAIIGFGRVGKIISQYYRAFGADVYFYDTEEISSDYAVRCSSIEEVIEKGNIIILCANYTEENRKMIGCRLFTQMKGKYFINAARGELVDEESLIDFIKKDWFRGVAVDVLSNETEKSSFLDELISLWPSRNIIVTPHIGGATFDSMQRTEDFIAEKLSTIIKAGGDEG